jgi:threonine/homoserine/homoserine lactone efflux protein
VTVEFLLTSLVLALLPGPGVVYVLSTGVTQGARAAVLGAVGCVVGATPYLVATVAGFDQLVTGQPIVFEVLKWAGVAYLIYLGVRTWRDRSRYEISLGGPRRPALVLVGYGALLSLLNPKLPIFFYAFLPRFLAADRGDVLLLCLTFLALVGIVYSGYGLLASFARQRLLRRPRAGGWARRVFAGCYGLLAARLALQVL